MILTIRTDKPEAEIGLFDNQGNEWVYKVWQAHKKLSETILISIQEVLDSKNLGYKDLTGLVFYKGPGSFTGLRIGASVANTIVYSQNIVSVNESGNDWIQQGIRRLNKGQTEVLLPFYATEPHITQQKK